MEPEIDAEPTDEQESIDAPELSEFEQAVVDQFDSEPDEPTADDPASSQADESVGAEGDDPQSAEASDETDPAQADPDDGGDRSSESDPAASSSPPETYTIAGQEIPAAQIEQLVGWANSLSAEDYQKIQAALYGPEAPASEPEPDPTPAVPQLDLSDVLDPKLAEYVQTTFGALSAEVESLRAAQAQQFQVEQAREQELMMQAWDEARTGVIDRLGLTQEDFDLLTTRVEQSGLVPYYAQQAGLSPKATFEKALETVYWSDEEFRARAIANATATASAEATSLSDKKHRASAAAGKGTNASRARKEPTTKEERYADMVTQIAAELAR